MNRVQLPNLITLGRTLLAFVNVWLFTLATTLWAVNGSLLLTAVVILLDGLDGLVARYFRAESRLGAELDIAADRIVENIYWVFFACAGVISFWIPVIVFTRGLATDFVRSAAARHGLSAFGGSTHISSLMGRALVCSRASRLIYGSAKAVAFATLAARLAGPVVGGAWQAIGRWAPAIAWLTVACCLLRAYPVIVEGWELVVGSVRQRSRALGTSGVAA